MVSDECDFLKEEAKQYLDDLSNKIRKNQVVLFAGGGLSRNAYRKDGKLEAKFPLWPDLTERMLKKLYGKNDERVKKERYDYLNVTDKYESEFGRISLYQLLEDALEDSEFEPGPIHQLISRFNWEILTTNFDTLIERGYELTNKTPNLIITDPDLSNTEKPRIFKINGCIKHARDQIIITGEDFRTFSERKPLIELYVKKCFIESTILFVGFSMTDPAFRMIYGWVRDHLLKSSENRFAYSIQFHVDDPTKKIWIPKGIRFIELFPNGSEDDRLAIKRLYSLFYELFHRQTDNKKREEDSDKKEQETTSTLSEDLEKSLSHFEREFKSFEGKPEIHGEIVKDRVGRQLLECQKVFLEGFIRQLDQDNKTGKLSKDDKEKGIILWEKFLDLAREYFCKKKEENILFDFLKEIIAKLEETDGKLFLLEKIPGDICILLKRILMKNNTEITDPNIWVMAIYIALRIGISHKLLSVDFFKKGFKIIRQTALKGDSKHEVSKDFHRYWLFSLMFIGPFKCTETLLEISRKKLIQQYPWDIPEYIHYHLEVFFGDRSQNRDLFLRALNNFRISNEAEAFNKFLLLDTFLDKSGFTDLFLIHTYQELSGRFRSKMYEFRNTLSSIGIPVKKSYFKSVVQTVFDGVFKGKSLMFTDLSDIILSFPKIIIEDRDIKALKETSLGELFLLATIYDKPRKGREKEKELKDFITTMIDSEVIDKSNFLHLLLSRLDDANLENMVQDVDNGLSRYLNGLVTFISCALPYLEKEDLFEIKKTIEFCLPQVKKDDIREAMVQIIAYIRDQLPDKDFTAVFKAIFSLATGSHFSSLGLKFLKLTKKELSDKSDKRVIRYSQLRLLLDRSLEEQGTPFDRDFFTFMLNHDREELFPGDDKRLKEILNTYFDIKTEKPKHLSLQWLMDLQQFVDKGFIQLNPDTEMEKRVRTFIDTASGIPGVLREWKLELFDGKMIKVYKTFAHLFDDQFVSKIIDAYRKDMSGKEEKDIKLAELAPRVQANFAHLLKEIYQSEYHNSLNETILKNIKEFIKEGLAGGGYLGTFWEQLNKKEKPQLIGIMVNFWLTGSEESILRAVRSAGEFLKYNTDEEAIKELTNRLLYCIFSGSVAVKAEWCKVVAAHINENSPWYTENKKKIVDCLNLFKKEKNLELLREFLVLARLFNKEEIKETITYLKKNAPYAEIRRAAGRF